MKQPIRNQPNFVRPRPLIRALAARKEGHPMNQSLKTVLVPALMLSATLSLMSCSGNTAPAANTRPSPTSPSPRPAARRP